MDVPAGVVALEVREWLWGRVGARRVPRLWTIEVVNGKITSKVPHPPTSLWIYEGPNGNFAII